MPIGDVSANRVEVAEAKAALRAWAVEADADIERRIEQARAQAKRLAPWAAGAGGLAVMLGLLGGRRGERASGGAGGWVGTARRGVGLATTAIGIARVAMPIVSELMAKRARKD